VNRLFSDVQRRRIFLAADGRCQKCGELLGEVWDAHHIVPHSLGGVTEVWNGMALCKPCHIDIHKEMIMSNKLAPRGWQEEAILEFDLAINTPDNKSFFLDAAPGAGKSLFSGFCAQKAFHAKKCDFVVIVSPSVNIKDNFAAAWRDLGFSISTNYKPDLTNDLPKRFNGLSITYQGLTPAIMSNFKRWADKGRRLLVVFDEVHHSCGNNSWGFNAESLGRMASFIISMTGTPFRSDQEQISFLKYETLKDVDGVVFKVPVANYSYRYLQGLRDQVLRPVYFQFADGRANYSVTRTNSNGIEETIKHSYLVSENEEAPVVRTLLDPKDSDDFIRQMIREADEELDRIRKDHPKAGGLIVCLPESQKDDNEESKEFLKAQDRMVDRVARIVEEVSSDKQYPTVVTSKDVDCAKEKIKKFKNGSSKWIVAIRMVSEGVDIPRLRVLVLACKPTSELLFRQMVGRVIRVQDRDASEYAKVFLMSAQTLKDFAEKFQDSVNLYEKEKRNPGESTPTDKVMRIEKEGSFYFGDDCIYQGEQGSQQLTSEWIEKCKIVNEMFPNQRSRQPVDWLALYNDGLINRDLFDNIEIGTRKTMADFESASQIDPDVVFKTIGRNFGRSISRSIGGKPEKDHYKKAWMALYRRFNFDNSKHVKNNATDDQLKQMIEFSENYIHVEEQFA